MVVIRQDYKEYVPPRWVTPTVERLVGSLADAHFNGLSAIVLTEASQVKGRKDGRRPRANRSAIAAGRYHQRWRGEPAWIELIVDNVVRDIPRPLRFLQFARDVAFARVLFHEVGHHLHATVGSAGREGESGARAWERRLSIMHFRQRYWFVRPLSPFFRPLASALRTVANMITKQ